MNWGINQVGIGNDGVIETKQGRAIIPKRTADHARCRAFEFRTRKIASKLAAMAASTMDLTETSAISMSQLCSDQSMAILPRFRLGQCLFCELDRVNANDVKTRFKNATSVSAPPLPPWRSLRRVASTCRRKPIRHRPCRPASLRSIRRKSGQ